MAKLTREQAGGLARTLMRIPVPLVYVLVYLAGVGLEASFFNWHYFSNTPFVSEAGVVMFLAGAALAGWGWLLFHKAKTTRIPGRASTTMVTWGPYRFTRNPMYLGLMAAYLGEAGIVKQLCPALLLPIVFIYLNWVVIPVEEAKLLQVFGPKYEEFRARVGRWL